MDFSLPADLIEYLAELDRFIEADIKPLQAQDDNERFFDHRREHSRTDWDNNGLPRPEWEALLGSPAGVPMLPAICALAGQINMAAAMARICGWP